MSDADSLRDEIDSLHAEVAALMEKYQETQQRAMTYAEELTKSEAQVAISVQDRDRLVYWLLRAWRLWDSQEREGYETPPSKVERHEAMQAVERLLRGMGYALYSDAALKLFAGGPR